MEQVLSSTDYQIIERIKNGDKKSEEVLFLKYRNLIHKQHHKLRGILKACKITFDDTYESIAFLAMRNAINGVRFEKIKSKDSWSFYFQFNGYLMASNKQIIRKLIKKHNFEISEFSMINQPDDSNEYSLLDLVALKEHFKDDSGVNESRNKLFWKIVSETYDCLTPKQKSVWKILQGDDRSSEKRKLEISQKDYAKEVGYIRKMLIFNLTSNKGFTGTKDLDSIKKTFSY